MRRHSRSVGIALLVGATAGCGAAREVTRGAAEALVSPEQEQQLGQQVEAEIASQAVRVEDPAIQAYVAEIGRRVAALSDGVRALPVRFVVLDAPDQINAFAIPGGTIYVLSGLLTSAQSEAELAGVLAHEVGHVTQRHVAQRLVTQFGMQSILGAALGSNPGMISQLAAQLAQTGVVIKYTRGQEREADREAVYALSRAGYSTDGLASFFRRLASERGEPGFLQFLETHPAPGDRAGEVDRLAGLLGASRGEVGEARYRRFVAQLRQYHAERPRGRTIL